MRNTNVRKLAVTLLILAFASAFVPMLAQEEDTYTLLPGEPNTTGGTYCFGPPDVRVNAMWHVFHMGWRTALADPKNAELREYLHGQPRESFRNNTVYYAVDPGECVWAPAGMKVYVPLQVQRIKKTTNSAPTGATNQANLTGQTGIDNTIPNSFWWWLLAFVVLAALILFGRWLYERSPTEWRPVVTGGIRDEAHAAEVLQQHAPRGGTLIQGSQRRVRLSGPWLTQHAGIPIPVPHRFNNERAWYGRFRMPNGTERESYMLAGCGNDVSAGARYIMLPGASVAEGWGEEVQTPPIPPSPPTPAQAEPVVPQPPAPPAQTPQEPPTGTRRVLLPGESVPAPRAHVTFAMQSGLPGDTCMIRWENGVAPVSFTSEEGVNTFRFIIRK